MKWVIALIDRFFSVVGALVFAQFPLYIEQYRQQLTGRIEELNRQITFIQAAAEKSGKTLTEYIQKFLGNSDIDISRQGDLMQAMLERLEQLKQTLSSLVDASIFSRPFVFITHLKLDVARSTYDSFQFGFPFSLEGLVYALVGIIFGFIVFQMLRTFFVRIYRIFFPKKSKIKKSESHRQDLP